MELLKKNRDMVFGEVKLTIMIKDPRDVERKRLLGIDDENAPTREDLAAALEEVFNDNQLDRQHFSRYILKKRYDRGSYGEVWMAFPWNCSHGNKTSENAKTPYSEDSDFDHSDDTKFILKRIMDMFDDGFGFPRAQVYSSPTLAAGISNLMHDFTFALAMNYYDCCKV
nr:ycf3-interacting protein 1, chloroplastic [Ipomoea batatas]